MVAGSSSCTCARCGAVCTGRFNGCAAVWAHGPIVGAPRLVELRVAPDPASRRWSEDLRPPDFTIRATPVAAAFAPLPEPAPEPPPESAPQPEPVAPPVVVKPPPRRRLAIGPHLDGLSQLRGHLDGLRSELTSLDDAVGTRAQKITPESGDTR
jgi:hypothetical protein